MAVQQQLQARYEKVELSLPQLIVAQKVQLIEEHGDVGDDDDVDGGESDSIGVDDGALHVADVVELDGVPRIQPLRNYHCKLGRFLVRSPHSLNSLHS